MATEFRRLCLALGFACLSLLSLPALAQTRVGVMTMEPGEIFWERFGHNAVIIDDGTQALSYNFGFFDLSEPGFTRNFIAGRMNYVLAALPMEEDLAYYRQAGRGVNIQWLNLTDAQTAHIEARLRFLARPENARYRYDYYTSNCATKIRDVLDETLGGALAKQLTASSLGNTYRSESVRLAWPAKWMAMGFDVAMSGNGDRPLSRWEDAFIPMLLAQSLGRITLEDGRPLVAGTQAILPHRLSRPPNELPQWSLTAMAIGLALAGLFAWAGRKPALQNALQLAFWLFSGLLGSALLAMWLGTEHVYAHRNENLLLFSPLALLAFGLYFAKGRGARWHRAYELTAIGLAALAVLAVVLKFMPFSVQQNLNWILMVLPLHWLIARRARPADGQK
jgi:hypothetical protein